MEVDLLSLAKDPITLFNTLSRIGSLVFLVPLHAKEYCKFVNYDHLTD